VTVTFSVATVSADVRSSVEVSVSAASGHSAPSGLLAVFLLAGVAMGLTACNTVHGAGEDLSIAGKATGTAVANAGHAISNTAQNIQ
jgi:predicted small secreted protein